MSVKVSVVTPFYNTERYLEDCIRSVLGQSMTDFEYVLVDNCSTDGSSAIAQRYAAADGRIRLFRNATLFDQVRNYNHALEQISLDSEYCKVVQADDWITERCLEELVDLADSDPSIGIVSSYRLLGKGVAGVGLPAPGRRGVSVMSGQNVCRLQLLEDRFLFGSPTTIMYRSEIVRERRPFFAEGLLHEDTESCYEILKDWRFGFVHQVLSFSRTQNDSIMSSARRYSAALLDRLIVTKKYGPWYLTSEELCDTWKRREAAYVRLLAESLLFPPGKDFWNYHHRGMKSIGYRPGKARMAAQVARLLATSMLHPRRTVERYLAAISSQRC